MYTFAYFTIALAILFILFAGWIGFPAASPLTEIWLLRGLTLALCTGVLLRASRRRLGHPRRERAAAQAELSIYDSEARFRAIFNDAAVGVGIMGLDRRIIDANSAMCRMFGRTRQELIGMNAVEGTYRGDLAESTQMFAEMISGQRRSYEVDRRYVRKNGEVFWAHITISVVSGPDGKPRYLVGMLIDIDEQKKMQERILESEARFRAMFDQAPMGIFLMSPDRRVLQVNWAAERVTGYPIPELTGAQPSFLSYPEDRERDQELFNQLIQGERDQYQLEKRCSRKDGAPFWGRLTYTNVRDKNGVPEYIIELIEDISEQRQIQEQLKEQEAEYRRTLEQSVEERTHKLAEANQRLKEQIEERRIIEEQLAHKAAQEAVTIERTRLARDLHDAVTQTLFSASLIAEVLPDLWETDIDEAKKSTEELRQLTRGALAEMRTLLLELRPATLTQTRLSDLIKQLCEAFIGRSRLPITLNIEGDCKLPPEVQVAFYRIAQESLNNVFKYARASQVNVNLFISPSTVHFETCDNGIGFDMSTIKPTSLGMRIMRERAEAIGADFHATSKLGSGTCVEATWNENPEVKLRVL